MPASPAPSPVAPDAPKTPIVAAAPIPDEEAIEAMRGAIRIAVERAMSSALAWRRETEARIARAEADLSTLRAAEQARLIAAARAAEEATVVNARAPEVLRAAAPPPLPMQPTPMPPAAPSVAMYSSIPVRVSLPSIEDVPFDIDMLPDALNGGRRKRAIAWGVLLLLLLGLGTLVVLAIASQAKHS